MKAQEDPNKRPAELTEGALARVVGGRKPYDKKSIEQNLYRLYLYYQVNHLSSDEFKRKAEAYLRTFDLTPEQKDNLQGIIAQYAKMLSDCEHQMIVKINFDRSLPL